ncbi:AAA family ATPase [Bdellovibrionota bacterium FG-2]
MHATERHITRELASIILDKLKSKGDSGVILSGVVGCGKTTLIKEQVIPHLPRDYEIFQFTGDDLHFRSKVQADTKYIFETVSSKTTRRAFVFVDEVQKCEEVFDALKFAFDHLKLSYIVSGSNPEYLNTVAKKRLQRRAEFLVLSPFSLPEILSHEGLLHLDESQRFFDLVNSGTLPDFSTINLTLTKRIERTISKYLRIGGLPLESPLRDLKTPRL